MQLTLAEISTLCLDHLADPSGTYFYVDRLQRAINEAYRDLVVDEIDPAVGTWDMAPTPLTVVVAAGVRDTKLTDANGAVHIRKPVDVNRIDSGWRTPVAIIPFGMRNRNTAMAPLRLSGTTQAGVYFFRSGANGDWYLGTAEQQPEAMTLEVHYAAPIAKLANNSDVPWIIPEDFHNLIPIKAAMFLKTQENRDASDLAGLYAERMQRFRAFLNKPDQPGRPIRL